MQPSWLHRRGVASLARCARRPPTELALEVPRLNGRRLLHACLHTVFHTVWVTVRDRRRPRSMDGSAGKVEREKGFEPSTSTLARGGWGFGSPAFPRALRWNIPPPGARWSHAEPRGGCEKGCDLGLPERTEHAVRRGARVVCGALVAVATTSTRPEWTSSARTPLPASERSQDAPTSSSSASSSSASRATFYAPLRPSAATYEQRAQERRAS